MFQNASFSSGTVKRTCLDSPGCNLTRWKPRSNVSLSVHPEVDFLHTYRQWVANVDDALNAATYGKYLLGALCRLPVALAAPSLFGIYRQPPRLEGCLVIGISQSGQSPDIVAVLAEARHQGAPTLAITNDPASPLAAEGDHLLLLHAGEEQAVAATKTYTTQLCALAMLSAALEGGEARWAQLSAVPGLVDQAIAANAGVEGKVDRYRYADHFAVVGRGFNYSTAFEVALKMKETSYLVAEPYSPADLLHGPVAMIDRGFPVLLVAPSGRVYAFYTYNGDNVRELDGSRMLAASLVATSIILRWVGSTAATTVRLLLASTPSWCDR